MHLSVFLKTWIVRGRSDFNPCEPQIPYLFDILAFSIEARLQDKFAEVAILLDEPESEHGLKHLLRVLWFLVS